MAWISTKISTTVSANTNQDGFSLTANPFFTLCIKAKFYDFPYFGFISVFVYVFQDSSTKAL